MAQHCDRYLIVWTGPTLAVEVPPTKESPDAWGFLVESEAPGAWWPRREASWYVTPRPRNAGQESQRNRRKGLPIRGRSCYNNGMSTSPSTLYTGRCGGRPVTPELGSVDEVREFIRTERPELVGLCVVTTRTVTPVVESTSPVFTDRHFVGRRNSDEDRSFGLGR